ncbi:uncharacterized protein LOC122811857 isoform X1 [Protopterus annectens]|uniref:uncharacterized protein LOC122811857 isoform X1 n=1 Tax=Protopterus annectens TaxID=7888 RepID=UPI001CFADF62|nr:uncharacterized protein LOC122811857 isoform X1 [Protopterus annectens]
MNKREKLLDVLEELKEKDRHKFIFHLKSLKERPPCSQIEHLQDIGLAEILLEFYGENKAWEVTKGVLSKIPRNDLLQKHFSNEERMDTSTPTKKHDVHERFQDKTKSDVCRENARKQNLNSHVFGKHSKNKHKSKRPLVTERQLMILAGNFGKEWKNIGIQFLGFANYEIEQFDEGNTDFKMKVFYMLLHWKRRGKEKATPRKLYKILSKPDVPLSIDKLSCLQKEKRK